MYETEGIVEAIFGAVEEINQQLPPEGQLGKSLDTHLLDKSGPLDSMKLVSLVVTIEQNIEEKYGISLILADEKSMSQENNPFQTIRTLADYIVRLLDEKENNTGVKTKF